MHKELNYIDKMCITRTHKKLNSSPKYTSPQWILLFSLQSNPSTKKLLCKELANVLHIQAVEQGIGYQLKSSSKKIDFGPQLLELTPMDRRHLRRIHYGQNFHRCRYYLKWSLVHRSVCILHSVEGKHSYNAENSPFHVCLQKYLLDNEKIIW